MVFRPRRNQSSNGKENKNGSQNTRKPYNNEKKCVKCEFKFMGTDSNMKNEYT